MNFYNPLHIDREPGEAQKKLFKALKEFENSIGFWCTKDSKFLKFVAPRCGCKCETCNLAKAVFDHPDWKK